MEDGKDSNLQPKKLRLLKMRAQNSASYARRRCLYEPDLVPARVRPYLCSWNKSRYLENLHANSQAMFIKSSSCTELAKCVLHERQETQNKQRREYVQIKKTPNWLASKNCRAKRFRTGWRAITTEPKDS